MEHENIQKFDGKQLSFFLKSFGWIFSCITKNYMSKISNINENIQIMHFSIFILNTKFYNETGKIKFTTFRHTRPV